MEIKEIKEELAKGQFKITELTALNESTKKQFPTLALTATLEKIDNFILGQYEYKDVEGVYIVIIALPKNGAYVATFDSYNRIRQDIDKIMTLEEAEEMVRLINDIIMESEMDAEIY